MSFSFFVKRTTVSAVIPVTAIFALSDAARFIVESRESALDPFADPPSPKSTHERIHEFGLYATSLSVRVAAVVVPIVVTTAVASTVAVHATAHALARDPTAMQRFLTSSFRMPLYVRLVPAMIVSYGISDQIIRHWTFPLAKDASERIWQQWLRPSNR